MSLTLIQLIGIILACLLGGVLVGFFVRKKVVESRIDAIEKFDPSREVKFKTYAEIRIKGAILDELRAMDWIPRSIRKVINRLVEAYHELEQRFGAGKKFLEENGKKEGVVTLPSGLQYKVIRQGKGNKPGPTDKVTVHYTGTLIDGTKIMSTYRKGKPETFFVNGVKKGMTEALQLMREGARWQLFIPPELAFSNRGPLHNRTLIYDIELISTGPADY